MNKLYFYLLSFVVLSPLGLFPAALDPIKTISNLKGAGSRIIKMITPRKSPRASVRVKKEITLDMKQKREVADRSLIEAETVLISRGFIISEANKESLDMQAQGVIKSLIEIYRDFDHASAQRSKALNLLCRVVAKTADDTPLYLVTFMLNERESLGNSTKLVDSVRHGRIEQALAWGLFAK